LRVLRIVLWAIGVLSLLSGTIEIALTKQVVKNAVDRELAKRPAGTFVDPAAIERAERLVRIEGIVFLGLGFTYVVFAMIVKVYPLPVALLSLLLYVGTAVTQLAMAPEAFLRINVWFFVRIIFFIGILAAPQAAIGYHKQREDVRRDRQDYDDDYEPA